MIFSDALIASIARIRPTVVFDLDGCLVHSSPDIAAALNAALAVHGVSFSVAEVERMVGDGLSVLYDRALAARDLAPSPDERKAGFEAFQTRYAADPAKHSELRGWVVDVARTLKAHGARTAICTNKVEPIALTVLDTLALRDTVHAIVGHLPGRAKKPDPEPMRLAVERAAGNMKRAVMVGDSAADLGAGRSVGMPVVLVTGGYGKDDVKTLGADAVVEDAEALLAAILGAAEARASA